MTATELEPKDRLIVALDVPTEREALQLIDDLRGLVSFFKVGYQLFLAEGMPFVRKLVERGERVFLDLKLDDVEETVALAVRQIAQSGVHFLTIHGNGATARAAIDGRAASKLPTILSVTLLTSLDAQDLKDLGILSRKSAFQSLEQYVLWRANQALNAGCEGLIAAGSNVADLRREQRDREPIIVCPGIRPAGVLNDDHKRPSTPLAAVKAGADYLVVGRPIRNAPDRRAVAQAIIDEIERGLPVAV